MLIWTNNAECVVAGLSRGCTLTETTSSIMYGLINLAVAETNVAYDESGINAQLRLVYAYRDDEYTELDPEDDESYNDIGSHVDALNYMDGSYDINDKRKQYGADLVHMIIDDGQYCGMAHSAHEKQYGYSVTWHQCTSGYFSFAHEIGHNLLCQHNRHSNCDNVTSTIAVDNMMMTPTSNIDLETGQLVNYNYAYRDPQSKFRTILGMDCHDNGACDIDSKNASSCPRIQRFSNTNFKYKSQKGERKRIVGTSIANNAKQINNRAKIVTDWYPTTVQVGVNTACTTDDDCNDNNYFTEDICVFNSKCHHVYCEKSNVELNIQTTNLRSNNGETTTTMVVLKDYNTNDIIVKDGPLPYDHEPNRLSYKYVQPLCVNTKYVLQINDDEIQKVFIIRSPSNTDHTTQIFVNDTYTSTTHSMFGISVDVDGSMGVVGTKGSAYRFDLVSQI